MLALLGQAWYAPQWISDFHFFDDWPEWQQLDKLAHLFWTFQVCVVATRLMMWATGDESRSARLGALTGFLLVSGIEIFDGFSVAYGASVYDVLANGAGALLFLGQRLVWKKLWLIPKFSFHPTSFAPLRPELLGNGLFEEILKDYNGQTFWYSIRVPVFPRWLTLAVGVGAEGMIYGREPENLAAGLDPHRRYFLSVDVDLSHLKPASRVLQLLLYVPSVIKIPAPTVEISSQGLRFHPLYF